MFISKLKIKGFRSFGAEVEIPLRTKLATFIGLNSSGKTTALEALRKMFGNSFGEKEIYRLDFHVAKGEDVDVVNEKNITIEVRIDFSDDEKDAIPHFFSHMVVDEEGQDPYLRIRLESKWSKSLLVQDGEVDTRIYFITVADGEEENEETKQAFPGHLRNLIQVLYVPAIRRPAEQIKYASGSILYRVLRRINWGTEFKKTFEEQIDSINASFKGLPEFTTIETSLKDFWQRFHKDERYRDSDLTFGGSDFDSILKKLEVCFSPTGTHRNYSVDDLGEGYRSLFYLTLVCALLDVEEKLEVESEEIGITRPLLTLLAIEEPENHIAPQLLGRVIKILNNISEKGNSQVLLSSHTPAIVKRVKVESICHFRISENYETVVNTILLPEDETDEYKFVKEAVHNYPEIYFARLVVIGEGDSEEVIFNRLMDVLNVDFDDNIITFAPLGHRFVNHIWSLLDELNIPYLTLLDLDLERNGGGWGRIKYALKQLISSGWDKDKVLALSNGEILEDKALKGMHEWGIDLKNIIAWTKRLEDFDVYFSKKLDLDFLMLEHYSDFYKKAIPKGGGPVIPDKTKFKEKFDAKLLASVQATLKSEEATGDLYTDEEKELMIWYNYHFLGRGKPSTHIQVLSKMKEEEIIENLPKVFTRIFDRIKEIMGIKSEESEKGK